MLVKDFDGFRLVFLKNESKERENSEKNCRYSAENSALFVYLYCSNKAKFERSEACYVHFLLDLFGSAYSISFDEYLSYVSNEEVREVLKNIFNKIPTIAEKHFASEPFQILCMILEGHVRISMKFLGLMLVMTLILQFHRF